ncbi:MAG: hypothetical protein QM737_10010 [Ferruginibacter sp.]
MKTTYSIRIKASFLLLIFALNTVVGFACAVGFDMGYNTNHHSDEEVEIHIHKDGSKHHHEKAHGHEHPKTSDKDDCCSNSVVKIAQVEKSVPHTIKLVNPVFFVAFTFTYLNIDMPFHSQARPFNKYYIRGYHPPISDIRIAIQSFQI